MLKNISAIIFALLLLRTEADAQFIRGYGLKLSAAYANQTRENKLSGYEDMNTERRRGMDGAAFIEVFNHPIVSFLGELHYLQKGFEATALLSTAERPDG